MLPGQQKILAAFSKHWKEVCKMEKSRDLKMDLCLQNYPLSYAWLCFQPWETKRENQVIYLKKNKKTNPNKVFFLSICTVKVLYVFAGSDPS